MCVSLIRRGFFSVGVIVFCACAASPTSLLEVRDPDGLAGDASELIFAIRTLDGELVVDSTRSLTEGFPVTITIAAVEAQTYEVTTTAVDSSSVAIARGRAVVTLSEATTPATLNLGLACEDDCNDGLFCNGEERCERGVCIRGPAPCQANFACVLKTCVEATDECSTSVDQSVCDTGDGVSRFCSPESGCVVGDPCDEDSECQDDSVCNGVERCVEFRCTAGVPPDPDDGSPCTIDGCNDANMSPIFNVQDPSVDGNTCDLADEGLGICLSSSPEICVESVCGDGFRDPAREPCDDGNAINTDDCTRTEATPGQLVCAHAVCGDGFVQEGVEVCDDGNTASGDGCRGDCVKIEVCHDGVLDAGEECDDGNTNPNDGCHTCRRTHWTATLLTGLGESGGEPLALGLFTHSVAVDRSGNLFVSDGVYHRVWRIDGATGFSTVLAGTGAPGFSGDGEAATNAQLDTPIGIAIDGLGNVYIADSGNHRVRRVCGGDAQCPAGIIQTVAGVDSSGSSGDNGPATSAELDSPRGLAVDGLGNVYIADRMNHAIRRVCMDGNGCTQGQITTVAGTLAESGDEEAQLSFPNAVAMDHRGNLVIADTGNHRIRLVCIREAPDCPLGTIQPLAGTGGVPKRSTAPAGGPALEMPLDRPEGVAVDHRGNLFILESSERRILKVCGNENPDCTEGTVVAFAGAGDYASEFSGDSGLATDATLGYSSGLAVDTEGNIFVAGNLRVREICASESGCAGPFEPQVQKGYIRTVVGSGQGLDRIGDEGPATSAQFGLVKGIALDGSGNLLIADYIKRIRQVCIGDSECSAGTIQTRVVLSQVPFDIAVDHFGNLLFPDANQDALFQVCAGDADCPKGTVRELPIDGSFGEGPRSIAVDAWGNIFYSDTSNRNKHYVKEVCVDEPGCTAGTIRTVVGDDDLYRPDGVAVDGQGNLLVADRDNHRILHVCSVRDPSCGEAGSIRTVAGTTREAGFSGDGGSATEAKLDSPAGVAVDALGNLLIADSGNHRVRKVCGSEDRDCGEPGTILTIAGTDAGPGFSGDGGPALNAQLAAPNRVLVDPRGGIYIAETMYVIEGEGFNFTEVYVNRIRYICGEGSGCPVGTIRTVAGEIDPVDGHLSRATLTEPLDLAPYGDQWLVADGSSGRVRLLDIAGDRLSTVVGYPSGFTGDAVDARLSRLLEGPGAIGVDGDRFFVGEADRGTVRVVHTRSEPWTVSTVDMGFSSPSALLVDGDRLLVADRDAHVVWSINPNVDESSSVDPSVVVGQLNSRGNSGDNGPASEALLNRPEALAFGPDGSLYIADSANNRVRRMDTSGIIETVLGTEGTAASSGSGSPARRFPVNKPLGLTTDSFGNLFVTSTTTVRQVTAGEDGVATGDDTVTTLYGAAPRSSFPDSVTNCLSGVAVTDGVDGAPDARLLILDACAGFAVALDRSP